MDVSHTDHYADHFRLMKDQPGAILIAPDGKPDYLARAGFYQQRFNPLDNVRAFLTDEECMRPEQLTQFSG
jgi:hypothetical protein